MSENGIASAPSGTLFRILDRLVRGLLFISKVMILVMAVHIVADAAIRSTSDLAISGTIEIASNYYMVALTFLPLAYIQRQRGHLIAEVFTQQLSRRARSLLDAVGDILMAVFLGLLVYQTGTAAIEATIAREYVELTESALPIWPAKWAVPIGFGVMALCALLQAGAIIVGHDEAPRGPDREGTL